MWLPVGSINTLFTLSSLNGSSISASHLHPPHSPSGTSPIFQRMKFFPSVAIAMIPFASASYALPIPFSSPTTWIVNGSDVFPFAVLRIAGIAIF